MQWLQLRRDCDRATMRLPCFELQLRVALILLLNTQ